MSAFKRRTATPSEAPLPGTRPSPLPPFRPILSSGIPSLDDVLGGGIPLSATALLLAPDPHSAWGILIQKYFIAQGLLSGHTVYVVGTQVQVDDLVSSCMWVPPQDGEPVSGDAQDDADGPSSSEGDRVRIAWRYKGMKRFSTTVPRDSLDSSGNSYCAPFDLTIALPEHILSTARTEGQLVTVEIEPGDSLDDTLRKILQALKLKSSSTASLLDMTLPVSRIALPFLLDSCTAFESSRASLLRFLHALRSQMRLARTATSLVTLPPHISAACLREDSAASVAHFSDTALTLRSDPLNPLPSHQGLVQVYKPHSLDCLAAPSDKLSTLRGLAQAAMMNSVAGRGENNLAFRCKRRQFIIETLHLDVEGGVGERRTEPSGSAGTMSEASLSRAPAEPTQVSIHQRVGPLGAGGTQQGRVQKVVFSSSDDLYDF